MGSAPSVPPPTSENAIPAIPSSGARSTSARILLDGLLDLTLERILLALGILASFAAFALFVRVVAGRLTHPYDIEWMEGGMLTHSLRLLEGRPIYAAPSADFISYVYQPLYAMVVAALGAV